MWRSEETWRTKETAQRKEKTTHQVWLWEREMSACGWSDLAKMPDIALTHCCHLPFPLPVSHLSAGGSVVQGGGGRTCVQEYRLWNQTAWFTSWFSVSIRCVILRSSLSLLLQFPTYKKIRIENHLLQRLVRRIICIGSQYTFSVESNNK